MQYFPYRVKFSVQTGFNILHLTYRDFKVREPLRN